MVVYEWVIEAVDKYGDIQDVTHADAFSVALKTAADIKKSGQRVEVGLVRDVFNDVDENLEDRQWAYLENGRLPERFSRGARVPRKFHGEVGRELKHAPNEHASETKHAGKTEP